MPVSDLQLHGIYTMDRVMLYVDEFKSIAPVQRSAGYRRHTFIRVETGTCELIFKYNRDGLFELIENNPIW